MPFLKKSVKKWDSVGQNSISGWGARGGSEEKWFSSNYNQFIAFQDQLMSWDVDLGSMNPFPLLKLKFRFLLFEKRFFWSILGGCIIFFFWWLFNPHLRSKSKFQVLNLRKIIETTYSESLKTFFPSNLFSITCFITCWSLCWSSHRNTQGQCTFQLYTVLWGLLNIILKKLQGVQSSNFHNMFLLWFSSA